MPVLVMVWGPSTALSSSSRIIVCLLEFPPCSLSVSQTLLENSKPLTIACIDVPCWRNCIGIFHEYSKEVKIVLNKWINKIY